MKEFDSEKISGYDHQKSLSTQASFLEVNFVEGNTTVLELGGIKQRGQCLNNVRAARRHPNLWRRAWRTTTPRHCETMSSYLGSSLYSLKNLWHCLVFSSVSVFWCRKMTVGK